MPDRTTWTFAERSCAQEEGGHLTEVTSNRHMQFLWDLASEQPFWIGEALVELIRMLSDSSCRFQRPSGGEHVGVDEWGSDAILQVAQRIPEARQHVLQALHSGVTQGRVGEPSVRHRHFQIYLLCAGAVTKEAKLADVEPSADSYSSSLAFLVQ